MRRSRPVGAAAPRRVLLVNQYFWPDMAATAQLLADLAEDLAAAGWQITALAGRGTYVAGRPGRLPRREGWQGVDIRRVACTDFGRASRLGALGRAADYATFLAAAALAVLTGPRHDVAICLSTPPLVAVLGLLARLRGTRFVYKVEDLYPDVAIALGALARDSAAARLLGRISRGLLARADAVVVLDEAMAATMRARTGRSATAARLVVIPNWADGQAIHPDAAAGARERRALEVETSDFMVLYSGNLGLAHRFDAVAAAARLLVRQAPEVVWQVVGGGPRLAELQEQVSGLAAVHFMGYRPREHLHALYNAADLHLVTLRDEVAGLLVPSKYAASLACGKPVLVVGGSGTELALEVVERDIGWVCSHDPAEVAAAVLAALREAAEGRLAERGARARRVFEERYSRERSSAAWARLLSQLAESG